MTVQEILTEAVRDLSEHGFDSETRLNDWLGRLRKAIRSNTKSPPAMEEAIRDALGSIYRRLTEKGQVLKQHPGIGKFTIDRIAPRLHLELERRIIASSQLIKLNCDEMREKTLRRLAGWATSIPKGGSETVDKRKVKQEIYKPIASQPFEVRRLLIDQGHKLNASISATIAEANGVIAKQWHSRWRRPGYNYREDHKERDENYYLVRGSWAQEQGFVKPRPNGYTDEITQVAEEPFCSCFYTSLYHLRQLPEDMLTEKGKEAIKAARAAA